MIYEVNKVRRPVAEAKAINKAVELLKVNARPLTSVTLTLLRTSAPLPRLTFAGAYEKQTMPGPFRWCSGAIKLWVRLSDLATGRAAPPPDSGGGSQPEDDVQDAAPLCGADRHSLLRHPDGQRRHRLS